MLKIENHQCEDCGTPPEFPKDPAFLSYYEGRNGDQWVAFQEDAESPLVVHGGDPGWENPHYVVVPDKAEVEAHIAKTWDPADGPQPDADTVHQMSQNFLIGPDGPIILDPGEAAWVRACLARYSNPPTVSMAEAVSRLHPT